MQVVLLLIQVVVILLVIAMVFVTLSLNTKSEGLGAAITGASDTYRGAVGVEEQKRGVLKHMAYGFLLLTLVYGVLLPWS